MILVLIGLLVFLIILTIGFHFLTIKKYKIIMFLLRDDLATVITKLTENSFETLRLIQGKENELNDIQIKVINHLNDLKVMINDFNKKVLDVLEEMKVPTSILESTTDELLITELRKIGQRLDLKIDSLNLSKKEITDNIQDVKNIIFTLKPKPRKKKKEDENT